MDTRCSFHVFYACYPDQYSSEKLGKKAVISGYRNTMKKYYNSINETEQILLKGGKIIKFESLDQEDILGTTTYKYKRFVIYRKKGTVFLSEISSDDHTLKPVDEKLIKEIVRQIVSKNL